MSAKDPFGLVGATIEGKYALLRVVGEGGFGVVYAARHQVLGSEVAVKVLKPQGGTVAEQQQLTDAFLREARVLFTLSHRAIVRFYEAGTVQVGVNALPYVVLELLQGHTLEDEIQRRIQARAHFGKDEIERIFGPVLEALTLAHEAGIVHRDLKPANIMLVRGEGGALAPKILDFGTARAGPMHASTTQVAFTPRYAAPEQWDPTYGVTGAWTDVFALGATLYEVCTLAAALPGDGVGQIMRSSLTFRERLDVTRVRPDLPPAFGPMLARSVAAQPTERFASAAAMRAAFAGASSAPAPGSGAYSAVPPAPPPPGPPPGPPPTTGPYATPTGATTGNPAAGYATTGPYPARPTNYTPWIIGLTAFLIGIFALVSCGSLGKACNALGQGDDPKPPPAKPPAAKGISFDKVDPRVQPALKPLELAPCFQKVATAGSYTVRLKRDGQALDAKCAPGGTVCTCVEQVVQEWSVPELKDGQGLSFTVLANP